MPEEALAAECVALAQRLSPEDVQLYYQIALLGRRDLPLAPDPLSGFDLAGYAVQERWTPEANAEIVDGNQRHLPRAVGGRSPRTSEFTLVWRSG